MCISELVNGHVQPQLHLCSLQSSFISWELPLDEPEGFPVLSDGSRIVLTVKKQKLLERKRKV
jgi:hypothetical protein